MEFSRCSLPLSEELDSCEGQRSLELADSVERGLAVGKALQNYKKKQQINNHDYFSLVLYKK